MSPFVPASATSPTTTKRDTADKPRSTTSQPTKAAKPTKTFFDPWNSSATGHQRAENRLSGSTSWRVSRSAKLGEQFRDGQRGGKRMYDTVGAGSEEFGLDGRLQNGGWEKGAKGLRRGGQISVLDAFDGAAKIIKPSSQESQEERSKKRRKLSGESEDMVTELPPSNQERNTTRQDDDVSRQEEPETPPKLPPEKQIFRNLCIYINGSTFPLISDHKLKRLLAEHGARLSIALGRRPVTHVVMGTPNSNGSGAGGGLAGGKIQKEIAAVKGCGIKFVSVEWVLESLKAGKRLPETRFGCLKIAAKGQKSVLGMLEKG